MTEHDGLTQQALREASHLREMQEEIFRATPFTTLSWEGWQETRSQTKRCLERFISAVEQKQVNTVLMIGLEMLEIAERMLLEGYTELALGDLAEACPGGQVAQEVQLKTEQ